MKLKLLFLLLLLCFPLVFSAPPVTTVQEFPEGYLLSEIPHNYLKQGQHYNYYVAVYNATNGYPINNDTVTCTFYMVNSSGDLQIEENMTYDSEGRWYYNINGSYLESLGDHPYHVSCYDDGLGGALSGNLFVNPTGYETDNLSVVYLILTTLVLLGIFLYLASQYMDNEKTFGVGLYFYLISFVLLVYVLFLQFNIMEKGLYWLGLTNIQLTLFSSITYSLIGITFIGFTYLLVKYLGNIKEYKSGVSYGDSYDPKSKSYQY